MRCRECGLEVDNDKAFCPVCGAPMKVTADYEYIQAEIANKVDRYFSEESEGDGTEADLNIIGETEPEPETGEEEPDTALEPPVGNTARRQTPKRTGGSKRSPKSSRSGKKDDAADEGAEVAKTRNIYGSDSIFDDDFPMDEEEDLPQRERPQRRSRSYEEGERQRRRSYDRPQVPEERSSSRKKDQTVAKIVTVLIIFVIIAAAVIGIMAILGVFNKNGRQGSTAPQSTASLTTNVVGGETYAAPVEITINNAVEGNVFYTLDGTEPSIDSRMYTGPFTVSPADVATTYPTVNLRAVSFSASSEKSGEINLSFSLEYDEAQAAQLQTEPESETTVLTLEAPVITPQTGSYQSDTEITVTAAQGADIYYTYDGSVPTTSSTRYLGSVKMIPGSSTFSAIAVKDGVTSDVASAAYTLEYEYNTSSDQAISAVINELLWDGYIIDYDANTWDGYAALSHKGVYEINGFTYYVIEADFYTSDGVLSSAEYLGVGVNYGSVYWMGVDGNSYYVR